MLSDVSKRRLKTASLFLGAVLCTGAAGLSAQSQIRDLEHFRGVVLPAALQLPGLEHGISVLSQQEEATEAERMLTGGEIEEHLRSDTVPLTLSRERIVGFVNDAVDELRRGSGLIDVSGVDIGDTPVVRDESGSSLSFYPVTLTVHLKSDADIVPSLSVFGVSGTLTVLDALPQQDVDMLLGLSEQENPSAIVSLQQFFNTDLLQYAQDSRNIQDDLLKSFSSPAFATALQAALQGDRIIAAQRLLGGPFGDHLQKDQLWPAPLLLLKNVDTEEQTDGSVTVHLTWETAVRAGSPLDPSGSQS